MVAKGEGRGEGCCCTDPERQPIKDFSKLITHGLLPGAEPEDEKKCFGSYVRCCTDLPVLILFIAFNLGMLVVLVLASEKADLNRLYYGSDFRGTVCNSGTMEGKTGQYWPNPLYFQQLGAVCLDSCPDSNSANITDGNSTALTNTSTINPDEYIVCVCNDQITVGQPGTLQQSGYSTLMCPQYYPNAIAVENSINRTDTYLGESCASVSGQQDGYVLFENSFCNQMFLWEYLPVQALSSTNTYETDTSSPYNGKVNVPVCNYMYKTQEVVGRCVPYLTYDEMVAMFCSGDSCGSDDLSSYFSGASEMTSEILSDLGKCWHIILASVGIALVVGFVYLCIMKYCTTCVVFTGLLMVIVSLTAATGAFFYYYDYLKQQTEITPQLATYDADVTYMNICLGVTIAFGAFDLIVICCVICMCKQIRVACVVLSLAADGIMDMPLLLFYPIGISLVLLSFVVVWIYGALYLATAGDVSYDVIYGYAIYTYDETLQASAVYWIFGLLWITEFMTSVGFMVVAMCFCIWFFTPTPNKDNTPVLELVHYSCEPTGDMVKGLECTKEPEEANYGCPCCCVPKCCADTEGQFEEREVEGGGWGEERGRRFEKRYTELAGKQVTDEELDAAEEAELKKMKVKKEEVKWQNKYLQVQYDEAMAGRSIGSGTGRLMPPCILYYAIKCTLLHHLGTVAFGSLIIAIIRFLILVVEYVEQKFKEMNGGEIPSYWKFIFCICKCFLWCLEQCMRFLNQNAYILTAINGTWFCTSACHAASVLVQRISYVFVTVCITSGMLVFGKLAIAFGTAAVGGYLCLSVPDISSIIAPTFLILIIGYAIAVLFCQVYEMGIDTVLMCFLEADTRDDIPSSSLPPAIRQFVDNAEQDHFDKEAEKKRAKKVKAPPATEDAKSGENVEMETAPGVQA